MITNRKFKIYSRHFLCSLLVLISLVLYSCHSSYVSLRKYESNPVPTLDSLSNVHDLELPTIDSWIRSTYDIEYMGTWEELLFVQPIKGKLVIISVGRYRGDSIYEIKYRVE